MLLIQVQNTLALNSIKRALESLKQQHEETKSAEEGSLGLRPYDSPYYRGLNN